ncbi:phosphatidylinositol-3,5-bisphosphate 3-phosphatase MTMR6-like isoform X2 [Oncorhynchus clarkii lewisi]|uniref:phosphatidylinositol-3,5-bisphosphate 3-phosphatase MTMR6-like isoform X2 n=1 Tax=Oncorhynchus clarkii lewisi TaxID=490388 RepID=UPI0039B85AC2
MPVASKKKQSNNISLPHLDSRCASHIAGQLFISLLALTAVSEMEHIRTPKVEQVRLLDRFSNKSTSGTLHLTATHLIFVESNADAAQEIWILHHHIGSVEKLPLTTSGCPLVIQCRNFRVVHFVVQRERDCHDIYSSLLRLLRPVSYEELYAFSYNPKQNEQQREEGWQLIDLGAEFERMGVPCDQWQLTDVNRNYKICETYPRDLYVPITASKPIIVGSSKFRSKGRFPVLTYFYQEKKAAVCRCSQPLSGFSARCLEDESMLQAISKANHNSRFVYVMDTRPKLNAMANRAAGKGYENEDNYSNIRFQFVGIENIHVMRTSLQKLLEVVGTRSLSVNDYLLGLESSGWLRHVKAVVDAAIFLTKAVTVEGASVLVHCSDGWDRTAQVCSLGALLMDPYYRTIKGFMVLIEKDWISFGHKFADRCDQLDGDPKEVSPVFTQFLECVWQLTEQFPQAFEFNEWLLLQIHEHVHSCQYGNFLANNQRQREELQLKDRTHSLWAFLLSEGQNYLNPAFCHTYAETHPVLEPSTLPCHLKFWRNMYHQFDRSMHPRQSVLKTVLTLKESNRQLEDTIMKLEARLQKHGISPPTPDPQAPPKDQRTLLNHTRPHSLILAAPLSLKEAQHQEEVGEEAKKCYSDTERTVEGSSGSERKESYGDLQGTYGAKVEPAVVSLEFGVARMTC